MVRHDFYARQRVPNVPLPIDERDCFEIRCLRSVNIQVSSFILGRTMKPWNVDPGPGRWGGGVELRGCDGALFSGGWIVMPYELTYGRVFVFLSPAWETCERLMVFIPPLLHCRGFVRWRLNVRVVSCRDKKTDTLWRLIQTALLCCVYWLVNLF